MPGQPLGIRPFGVEAQRLLRRTVRRHVIVGVDTDALTNPFEAGMGWVVKLDKPDFIGRVRACNALVGAAIEQILVGFIMTANEVCPEDGAAILIAGDGACSPLPARVSSPPNGKVIGLGWVTGWSCC